MAVRTGYGPGFCARVKPGTECLNMAKGGRSTLSYRAEGSWEEVRKILADRSRTTYVLIQFGHNDQPGKAGRSTDLGTEFPRNLRAYVEEVRAAGARPVLVTPLTRRSFKDGELKDDLAGWAEAARQVARDEAIPLLDLNMESSAAVQRMGPLEAITMAMEAPPAEVVRAAATGTTIAAPKEGSAFDYTHVGPKGADFFGRMVAGELVRAVPELAASFKGREE